jgi:hypothetical protein
LEYRPSLWITHMYVCIKERERRYSFVLLEIPHENKFTILSQKRERALRYPCDLFPGASSLVASY